MSEAVNTFLGSSGARLSILQMALVVAPAFILFGYNQAGLGGLISLPDWVATFPEIDTVHKKDEGTSTLKGFVVATFVVGALVGALTCSYTGDIFGRRKVIFAAGVCTLIGVILEAASFGLAQFIVGRLIIGFGVGNLSSIVPVWQAETSGAKNRGKHVVLTGLFMCVGYTLESWINLGFFVSYEESPVAWRAPIAIGVVFSMVLIGSIFLFPESPRWLVGKGRSAEARYALSALRGLPGDSVEVQAELSGIEHSLEDDTGKSAGLLDLLKAGEDKLSYRFGLCMLLQFFQQMCGSNLVSVYATILFQDNLKMDAELSRVLTGGALTWKFLSSFVAFVTIDRFGRRAVFIVSGIGMACCMTSLAITTSFPTENRAAMIAAGFFIYMFNFFVPIGFLGANFLYCTEIAPLRLRMKMSSLSTANHWLWNFVVIMVTPVAIDSIGYQYYIVFAVISACIPLSVYFLFPETMGRNLEEINLLFRDSPSAWATVRFAKKRPIGMPQEFERDENKHGVQDKADHVEEKLSSSS